MDIDFEIVLNESNDNISFFINDKSRFMPYWVDCDIIENSFKNGFNGSPKLYECVKEKYNIG